MTRKYCVIQSIDIFLAQSTCPFNFRVADQPHEQAVQRETQSRPAASPLWPGYWAYTEEDYRGEYEESDQENRVGRVVTKSGGLGRNTRLVTRDEEEAEDSNALRLQSGGVSQSSPLLLVSLGAAVLALVWL